MKAPSKSPSGPRKSIIEKDRRQTDTRRHGDDRREFPPRPEGRRRSGGRRITDPKDP